jgi:hypothetical protein
MSTIYKTQDFKNVVPDHCCSYIVNCENIASKRSIVTAIVENYKIKYPHIQVTTTEDYHNLLETDNVINSTEQIKNLINRQLIMKEKNESKYHALLIINIVDPNDKELEPILSELIHNSQINCLAVIITDNNFITNFPKLAPFSYKIILK